MLCAKVKLCLAAAMASALAGTAPVIVQSGARPPDDRAAQTTPPVQSTTQSHDVKFDLAAKTNLTAAVSDWESLIKSDDDLSGWKVEDGKWRMVNGVLIGETPSPSKSWIATASDYEHFELTGQIRVINGWQAEVRFWEYDQYVLLEIEKSANNEWQEIRIVVDNREMSATMNGKPLTILHGITPNDNSRRISFIADGDKRLELSNIRIRRLQASPVFETELSF